MEKQAILFVCLGNICRSPVAEGVFRKKAKEANILDRLVVDSAGTAAWHVGKSPDERMMAAAQERGYDLSSLRARQAVSSDFEKFDHILAMDTDNLYSLQDIEPSSAKADLRLFLNYAENIKSKDVPDPYYGKTEGFNHVIDLVEEASEGLLAKIIKELSKQNIS
jgi:protein-tyrosine phosphatase